MSAPSIAAIDEAWVKHVNIEQPDRESQTRRHLYASGRRKCLRRSVLEMTKPEAFPRFETEAKARMQRGNDRERDINIDLTMVGNLCKPSFEVMAGQERIEIKNRQGGNLITGYIDGRLRWENKSTWPYEVKSWSPFLTDRIFNFDDLWKNQWTWSGAHQLLCYLFATGEPRGILVLDRPGLPRLIEVELEPYLQDMEDFLQDAEKCQSHIDEKTLPEFTEDTDLCRQCPAFGSGCQPPTFAEGSDVITNEILLHDIEERESLVEPAKRFKKLDEKVKAQLRGVTNAIAGAFHIEGKWGKSSKLNTDTMIKRTRQRYEQMLEQHTVEDPKGRFTLKITKL